MLTIELEAAKCQRMLNKNSMYDVDDLIHEGVIVFFTACEKFNPDSNASFSTFFHKILINHLNCILIDSYGRPMNYLEKDSPPLLISQDVDEFTKLSAKSLSPLLVCGILSSINRMSDRAKEYILICVNPTKEIQNTIVKNPRLKFEALRKHFDISWKEDFETRQEIREILEV
jgi:hypothetical protein